jgi:sugar lactone lactonase YvrE
MPPELDREPVLVATSEHQWTGVAVTGEGRVFVNFPRWWADVPISVGELLADGTVAPYPDERWNAWTPEAEADSHFVCVQSVYADRVDRLWILDPANAWFQGVVPGGPKLVHVDPATDSIVRIYRFDGTVARPMSYLNDVRVDVDRGVAYITDSGSPGIVVLDLETGAARRTLDGVPPTRAERITLTIGGREWVGPGGLSPQVHSDGIALTHDGEWLYFQPLTGRTLYRVETRYLRDPDLADAQRLRHLEAVGETGSSDGLIADDAGWVYLSNLELDAVRRVSPWGEVEEVAASPRISWPDSFAFGADGSLYFTTSRIHEGATPTEPYAIYRLERR